MILQLNGWLRLVISLLSFPLLLPCRLVRAQTFQFLPEIDTYSTLQRNVRFNFQVKETREAGDPTQAEIGPSCDFFLKPLAHLKRIAVFDQDDSLRLDSCNCPLATAMFRQRINLTHNASQRPPPLRFRSSPTS
jgi:hypothetical protein